MSKHFLYPTLALLSIVLGVCAVFWERETTVLLWFFVALGISGVVAVVHENLGKAVNASLLFLVLAFLVNQVCVAYIRKQAGFDPLIVWDRFFLGFAVIFSAGTLLTFAGSWTILRHKLLFLLLAVLGAIGIALSI